ncbi:MAG: zinc-ribbon domain-containing protein [Candidatus Heimdallarchaeota archaeon]
MTSQIYCSHCGSGNDPGTKFCVSCGASIDSKPQQQPVQQPQPVHQQQPVVSVAVLPPQRQSNGAAVTSLITGIIGFIIAWIPFVSIISPILLLTALITGIIGVTKPTGKGMAIAGIVLSVMAGIAFTMVLVFLSYFFIPIF